MLFRDMVEEELRFQQHMYDQYDRLRKICAEGTLYMKKKKRGYREYYLRTASGVSKYVGKSELDKVVRIQAQKMGCCGAARAEENIKLLKHVLTRYMPCDFASVQQALDEKYRMAGHEKLLRETEALLKTVPPSQNPFHTGELKHSTTFGLMVRSKNEAHIAERLFAVRTCGLEFYYERAKKLRHPDGHIVTRYPDFTIVLPDGRTIYWEHAGRMDDPGYARRHNNKMQLFYANGIYAPFNLIVTSDGPRGEYPGAQINHIIERLLVPLCCERVCSDGW